MFDRGLMTVTDDLAIRLVRDAVPDPIRALINPTGKLILPQDSSTHPNPYFLKYHREHVFKGGAHDA